MTLKCDTRLKYFNKRPLLLNAPPKNEYSKEKVTFQIMNSLKGGNSKYFMGTNFCGN